MGRSQWAGAILAAVALAGCGGSDSKPAQKPTSKPRAPAARTDLASVAARARRVPVLCYHQIRPQTAADAAQDRPYIVSPAVLERQMAALDRAGYHPVSGEAVLDYVARGVPLPRKPVLITFDDASAGQYTRALPILKRHRFVATYFVMTVVLGKEGWLTKGQVRALDRAGMTIGAHTYDHQPVPKYEGTAWATQIDEPTRELSKLVGHPIRLFAYPFGLWDRRAIPHLFGAGVRGAFQLSERFDAEHPLWNIRRAITTESSGAELLRQLRS